LVGWCLITIAGLVRFRYRSCFGLLRLVRGSLRFRSLRFLLRLVNLLRHVGSHYIWFLRFSLVWVGWFWFIPLPFSSLVLPGYYWLLVPFWFVTFTFPFVWVVCTGSRLRVTRLAVWLFLVLCTLRYGSGSGSLVWFVGSLVLLVCCLLGSWFWLAFITVCYWFVWLVYVYVATFCSFQFVPVSSFCSGFVVWLVPRWFVLVRSVRSWFGSLRFGLVGWVLG